MHDVTLLQHSVKFTSPLGRGLEVVEILFNTSSPRMLCYYEAEGRKEPIAVSIEDLKWFLEEAVSRRAALGY